MMRHNEQDIMRIALKASQEALDAGEYPVTAVLVIDDEIVEVLSNRNISHSSWGSHAESLILQKHSSMIREATKRLSLKEEMPGKVELYSTLEPCLMCLGTAVLHKVKRIVYSCPDPRGGVTNLVKPEQLTEFYRQRWPEIKGNVLRQDSYKLITSYISRQPEDFWPEILEAFKAMYLNKEQST